MRSGRSWPSSRRERANLRARRRLEDAPSAPCPHCGRVTKTVDGMCADCWGVKDPARARRWLPRPRREPLFGFEWEDPLDLLWAFGAVVLIVLVAIYALTQWI
jgi:hypothetical protein